MKKQKFEFNVVDMYEEQLNRLSEIVSDKDLIIQEMEEQLVLRDNYIQSMEKSYHYFKLKLESYERMLGKEPDGAVLL